MSLFLNISLFSQQYKTITDSLYKITVPVNMEPVGGLAEGNVLQLKSTSPVLYSVTIRAEQKSLIDAIDPGFTNLQYHKYVTKKVAEKLKSPKISQAVSDTVSKVHYVHGEVRGKFQGTALIYFVRTFETAEYSYYVITLMEEKSEEKTAIGRDLYEILNSFQPLK